MARRAAGLDLDAVLAEALAEPAADPDGDAMLDATGALLGLFGLRRWTMEDVAERAGLARATVYRRFDSRDRLVRAALIRDARRFFAAIAVAVEAAASLEEKVVEGFVVGVGLARLSPVPTLLGTDPAAALALITSEPLLVAGRRALVESYETLTGAPVADSERPTVEAVAEALIRLALSLLMTPGLLTGQPVAGGRPEPDPEGMRQMLAAVIGPLLDPADGSRLRTRSAPRR